MFKNKIAILVSAAALFCAAACTGNKEPKHAGSGEYTISGTVSKEVKSEWIYLYSVNVNNPVAFDSTRIENGKFQFYGKVPNEITLAVVHPGSVDEYPAVSWNVILEEGDLLADSNNEFVTGSPLNDGLKSWMTQIADIFRSGGTPDELTDFLKSHWQEHGEDFVGAWTLAMTWPMLDFYFVDSLTMEMPRELKRVTLLKETLFDPIRAVRDMQPGRPFKDATLTTLDGKSVMLSEYIGKGDYLLVDFWASWCGPCRQSIPELQEIARRHRNLKVLGVAISDKTPDTKTAIAQLNIKWPVICDPQSLTGQLYGFNSIPFMMLFAPDGTILARDVRLNNLERILEENIK